MRPYLVFLAGFLIACQGNGLDEASKTQDVITTITAYDFGSVPVGQASAAHPITINPGAGNTSDQITAISASCPDFSIDAPNLPATVFRVCEIMTCLRDCPEPVRSKSPAAAPPLPCQTTDSDNYTFYATYHPTVAGTVSCVVNVQTDPSGDGRTLTLTGTGTVPPVQIDVQPGSVAFGDVRRNTASSAATINVRSVGGSTLSVGAAGVTGGFTITGPTGGYALPPGGVQGYAVTCNPTAVGGLSGTFSVASNDPARPTVTIPLSCNGIDSNLDIRPSLTALPDTRVGEPLDATITLVNTGGADMSLESVSLASDNPMLALGSAPGATTLPASSGQMQVTVHFDAQAKGAASAALTAKYDGGQVRTSQITARALATSLALTPDGAVDFGPVCGGQSKTQDFTVIANDQGWFTVSAITAPDAPFTVMPAALPAKVLGAGASQLKFQIAAAPADAGVVTTQVALKTDIPGATDHMLSLTVEGLPPGISATPAMVDLGSNPIDTTTIGQQVHLSNCGAAPLAFTNPRIEGADALDFAIVQQPDSATISPAGNATWLIVLTAHTVGVKAAVFSVDYDGGTASVDLAGEGLGAMPDGPGDGTGDKRNSYYACSAGGAGTGALWLLGGVAVVVGRRRSRRA
ncbi:MAG TPA: choice-of-anchor D domain-containing protein [Kofleriaceae bacterium]